MAFQIHHIIPVEEFNNPDLRQKLREAFGVDQLQSFNNRLPIFGQEFKDSTTNNFKF